jgi:hypothetical protein
MTFILFLAGIFRPFL